MDTVKIDRKNVLMVAHRGLSGIETENTNLAFVAAGNRSYYGIETDVHFTADGKFVIIHDNNTGRVSKEDALDVETTDYETLKGIRLADREDGATRRDIIIPDLDDYFKICRRYGKVCVLEIKNTMTREMLETIVEAAKARDYLENVIFISFTLSNLVCLREITPDNQRIQLLCGELDDGTIDYLAERKIDIDIHYPTLFAHPEYMEKFRARNMKVNCWTCDNPDDAKKLIEMGVDFITSNILE